MGLLDLAIAAGGALLGSKSSKDQTQTVSKDPWGPAQPYLLNNLQTNQQLQQFYQQNPFNAQQKVGLQNTMGDADNFRANVMPGLMDFANKGMTSSYQRQTGGAVGSGGGYGGAVVPGGMRQSGTGPFQAPTGGMFGTVDWNANNPFSAQNKPVTQTSAQVGLLGGGGVGGVGGMNGGGSDGSQPGTPFGGIGVGPATDKIQADAMAIAERFGLASPIAGVVAGLMSYGMSMNDAMAAVNASPDPIAALNALQGWTGTELGTPGYNGDPHGGYGPDGNTNDGAGGYGGADNGY